MATAAKKKAANGKKNGKAAKELKAKEKPIKLGTGKEVAKVDTKAVSTEVNDLFANAAGEGFEETTSDDYVLPFLKVLQKMSPEVDPDDGAYIEGAKPGLFFDTATFEMFEEVHIIPCHYHRAMVEWRDRDDGGGFVAHREVGYEQQFEREKGKWFTGEGTYLSDTRYFFCLRITEDGTALPIVVALSSTQIKKARSWMTRMQGMTGVNGKGERFKLPLFANVWKCSTVPEENDQGSWRGWKIELDKRMDDAVLVQAAREAREMFKAAQNNFKPPESAVKDEGGGAEEKTPY